ncbi:PEPxxWA-CTERM sorting domain-containing protein [Phenylobacterium sp.]|uniref:PEPxxWA-CTERM sorting domain-containing protein n=1 Tax=Phenylobacterium sp. TaxID=1871053 RepID=UPI0025DEBD1D|nr:PEPxxWA-CTERM sorting domain-containing protein [Phenylobacterium sp.]
MTLHRTLALAAFALAVATAAAAQAATLYDAPGATAELPTNSSYSATFNGPAGPASLSFVLNGYASLDGQNWYEDDFNLSLNGASVIKGTFNLGGGGNDLVFLAPGAATLDNVSGNGTAVTWAGGHVNITTPLNLIAGANTLTFAYNSLGAGHAGFQGTGDEGWGVQAIKVTSDGRGPTGGVPEPASWALMILGFGALGTMVRRQRAMRLA